jgi:hypothetical protein
MCIGQLADHIPDPALPAAVAFIILAKAERCIHPLADLILAPALPAAVAFIILAEVEPCIHPSADLIPDPALRAAAASTIQAGVELVLALASRAVVMCFPPLAEVVEIALVAAEREVALALLAACVLQMAAELVLPAVLLATVEYVLLQLAPLAQPQ